MSSPPDHRHKPGPDQPTHPHPQDHDHDHDHGHGHGQVARPPAAGAHPACEMPTPAALGEQPPLPAETPVFAEPWQAQAFAMTLQLHQRGLFSWPQWAAALSAQISAAQASGDADLGDTYWRHWLTALEHLVAQQGAGSASELARSAQAWAAAAERTPHGAPITLGAQDYA